jgi:hypothetical protein
MSPFDFLNSINEKKAYLFDDVRADNSGEASDLDSVDRKYPPFMVNRGLSYFVDTIMLANEMNQRFELTKKMQYDFLYHGVRKKRRFSKWHKKEKDSKDIELIKEAYCINRERAEEVYDLIDMKKLRKFMDKGGTK